MRPHAKPHDDGYFLLDSKGDLFHLKQVKGAPVCRDTGIHPAGGIRYLAVTEDPRTEFYGYFITADVASSI